MDPILGAVLLTGLIFAARAAGEHLAGEYRKSRTARLREAVRAAEPGKLTTPQKRAVVRRHRAGWWAREVGRGFPVTRTGWHAGWLAHRTAAAHGKARREEARTTQVETEASILSGLREHKQRQAEALAQIRDELDRQNQGAGGKEAARQAGAKVLPFRRPQPPAPPGGEAGRWLRAPMPDPRLNDAQRERDASGQQNICAACGKPGSAGDPLMVAGDGYRIHQSHTADPSSGYHGQNGSTPAASPAASTEGNTVAETNYSNVYTYLTQTVTGLDQDLAQVDMNISESSRMAEDMQAMDMDAATLGMAMELVERWQAERAALAAIQEQAIALRESLAQRHGALAEAHANAPVRAAKREMYEE